VKVIVRGVQAVDASGTSSDLFLLTLIVGPLNVQTDVIRATFI
jgi:hypothetical protein